MNLKKQYVIAAIRTILVTPIAGFCITWLVAHGIKIEESWVYSAFTILFSGIYYLVVHMVEVLAKNPRIKYWAGIFLGYPSTPKYKEQ